MNNMYFDFILLLESSFRMATPLVFAALGGLYAERAGIVDLGLEGKMLGAAFASASTAAFTGSVWAGLLAGILFSVIFALLHGFVAITQRGNQIVSGMAINIIVAGVAPTLANHWFHFNGQTPMLSGDARFQPISFPFRDQIGEIPLIGPLYAQVMSGHSLMTYLSVVVLVFATYVLYKTRFGLRLQAAGENPEAVDTAGLNVYLLRYQALIITGILCGMAGTSLSTALGAGFLRDMSAGKGYLALAAMIFGKWKPVPTFFACLLFGFVDALQSRLQGVDLPLIGAIPVQFTMMLPYILTVLILAGFVGRINAPKASGIPYVKER